VKLEDLKLKILIQIIDRSTPIIRSAFLDFHCAAMNLRDAEIGLRSQQEKYKSALNKMNQGLAPMPSENNIYEVR